MSKRQEKIAARVAERDEYMKSVYTTRISNLEQLLDAGEKWFENNKESLTDADIEVVEKARAADKEALENLRKLYNL